LIEGTYFGCNDTMFPGLFVEGRRQLQKFLRVAPRLRMLQDTMENSTMEDCPVCDGGTVGFISPSTEELTGVLKDYISGIPTICELTAASLVNETATP
jgi:hypothetical protein